MSKYATNSDLDYLKAQINCLRMEFEGLETRVNIKLEGMSKLIGGMLKLNSIKSENHEKEKPKEDSTTDKSPDEWKELEIYTKVGFMDPTVFVPVLVLEKGTKFVGKPIKLEDASASDIVAKIKDIRAQARALAIPKTVVVTDRPLNDAFPDYLINEGVANEYRYDEHFYDFFEELSQSEAIHSFLDRIH